MRELRTCAIHQPNFFPRIATLGKILSADCWVVLDDVQFTRRDYQHRCRLSTHEPGNHSQWLSLSVHLPHGRGTRINEAVIVDSGRCRRRIFGLLAEYYGRTPQWCRLRSVISPVAETLLSTNSLAAIAELSTQVLLDELGWQGTIVHSSDFAVSGERSARLADLAEAAGCTTYLYGRGGSRYLNFAPFLTRGFRTCRYAVPDQPPFIHEFAPNATALASLAYADATTVAAALRLGT